MIWTLAQVAAGGALGAMGRYLSGRAMTALLGPGFPWGTLTVNVLGGVLMGVFVHLLATFGSNRLAPFLLTGFLGGFTTFSSFSLDAVTLWERGAPGLSAVYVAGSVILSLAGLVAGLQLARALL